MSVKKISKNDILNEIRNQITTADYSPEKVISGVKFIELENHILEEGDLSEIIRVNSRGFVEQVPHFKLAQINRVRQIPDSIKAWHLHYNQDEIWYVAPSEDLFVGLWDIRKNSETANLSMRLTLGGGKSMLLYIPRGIAHGSANFSQNPADLYSVVNRTFDLKKPDEMRLPWDSLGEEFWQPLKD
ncbi:MAG: hypothetical protein US51_C0046G0005 [Microgenomates group bacterium GW2011_GWA2_37_6]|nr:MAG: hypothetical protein US51_C0046G0005 [Microgenomates group bacterium GW2011_GWA2_37_6]